MNIINYLKSSEFLLSDSYDFKSISHANLDLDMLQNIINQLNKIRQTIINYS